MVVLSNRRLGPRAELLVSDDVAHAILQATAAAARPIAEGRWELELVRWLETRGDRWGAVLDVSEIAWTPDHFEAQRRFLVDAITRAALDCIHATALDHWRRLVEAHPRDSVQVGRRWQWTQVSELPRNS
jgi:hypothetical protein